jgi:hypothetical protein
VKSICPSSGSYNTMASILTASMSLSTFSFSSRVGRRVMSLESSGNTKRHCRSVDGQTGFSATTTGRASHPGSVRRRRVWGRCCCSPCAARRRFTLAMRSACVTWTPPEKVQDPFEKNVPGRGLGRDPQRTPMQWSTQRTPDRLHKRPGGSRASRFSEIAHEWSPLVNNRDDY